MFAFETEEEEVMTLPFRLSNSSSLIPNLAIEFPNPKIKDPECFPFVLRTGFNSLNERVSGFKSGLYELESVLLNLGGLDWNLATPSASELKDEFGARFRMLPPAEFLIDEEE